jgi:hypothetical protein
MMVNFMLCILPQKTKQNKKQYSYPAIPRLNPKELKTNTRRKNSHLQSYYSGGRDWDFSSWRQPRQKVCKTPSQPIESWVWWHAHVVPATQGV